MRHADGVVDFGGSGRPIVLLHGLMGRATTWWPLARWLTAYGHVVGLDARAHGRSPHPSPRDVPVTTEDFAADVAEFVERLDEGPAVVIGHSMGGLHGLVLAATRPDLVRGLVTEDIAVDQRGRTVDAWRAHFDSWPVPFTSLAHVREFFGDAGDYFVECFTEHADGYRLIADLEDLYVIAAEWGRREYWSYVDDIACPLLVVEAGDTAMPEGGQAELARRAGGRHIVVEGAGHVVHDSAPEQYRGAVEAFLSDVLGR